MKEPKYILEPLTKIRTNDFVRPSLPGVFVAEKYIERRKPNTNGLIWGFVAGCGGDIYWVYHGDEAPENPTREGLEPHMAVYGWQDFEYRDLFEFPNEIPLDKVCEIGDTTHTSSIK